MNRMIDRHRFIILTDQRSGSNYLGDLLDSHRSVRVAGEIFNPNYRHTAGDNLAEGLVDLRRRDPIAYLEAFFTQPLDDSISHLGFRLFHDHARGKGDKSIWTALRRMKGLLVVHLQRRNILRNLLSLKLAMRSRKWQRVDGEPAVRYEPVTLDFDEVVAHIEARERSVAEGNRFFRGHRIMDVFYEDLVRDETGQLNDLLRFLGLPPQSLTKKTLKQNHQRTEDLIENHAELAARFRHTRWHEFFEE